VTIDIRRVCFVFFLRAAQYVIRPVGTAHVIFIFFIIFPQNHLYTYEYKICATCKISTDRRVSLITDSALLLKIILSRTNIMVESQNNDYIITPLRRVFGESDLATLPVGIYRYINYPKTAEFVQDHQPLQVLSGRNNTVPCVP